MKKTLWMTMLAAALMGGQVFADATGTTVEGYTKQDEPYEGYPYYYGKYSDSDSVTGGNVIIKADAKGEVSNKATVHGGYSNGNNADVSASYNMVTMSGGTVLDVYAGWVGRSATASNNVVIVTEGSITNILHAGYANGGTATNNSIYLVGKGAENVSIANGTYTGGDGGITIGTVRTGFDGGMKKSEGNSIDIYGTGIVTGGIDGAYTQMLTFNITDGQVTGTPADPALSLTSTDMTFISESMELKVNDFDVKKWTPGATITLVQADRTGREDRIRQDLKDGMTVDIMRGDLVTATGTLILSSDYKQLLLTNIQGVPEPTTGTLSLLALAGLCARRRRK